MKKAMVRFRGAREKGVIAFEECLGVSQEDTMEDPLRREPLGRRSLGLHDAAELVDGMCHGNGCRQETTRLHHAISCTKTGWSFLTHNRVLYQALARSLRESKVLFVIENTWPFRGRSSGQNDRLNPLRMDITTKAGALFDNHPQRKNKALLLDITIVNPCAGSNLENAECYVGKPSPTQSSGTKTSIGARSPILTPSFLSLCRLVVRLTHTCMPLSRSSGRAQVGDTLQRGTSSGGRGGSSTSSVTIFFCFTAGPFVLYVSPSLQTEGGACEHPMARSARPGVCTRASYRRGNRVRGTGRSE